jgi:NADH:ubiquinone oxidoreductase subunit 3 (subunit A)
MYYKKYNCDFISCLTQGGTENLLIFFSEQSNLFFNSVLIYSILLTVFGISLIFISSENWIVRLKSLGWSSIFVAIPLILLPYFGNMVSNNIVLPGNLDLTSIVNGIFAPIQISLVLTLIFGIMLIISGYYIERRSLISKKKK